MLINEGYQQAPHALPPAWDSDLPLKSLLRRILPSAVYAEVDDHLRGFQDRLAGRASDRLLLKSVAHSWLFSDPSIGAPRRWTGRRTDAHAIQSVWSTRRYAQDIRRLERIETDLGGRRPSRRGLREEAWRVLTHHQLCQGMFSSSHLQSWGLTVLFQGYLMVPEGRYIGCPLSMSDGAARVLELYGTEAMKKEIIPRLISRDPDVAWTAGQCQSPRPFSHDDTETAHQGMTEKPGGSDVSLTETVARPRVRLMIASRLYVISDHETTQNTDPSYVAQPGDEFILDGFKWFSSATDGDVALALARTGATNTGSRGLSLFLIKLRDESGKMNGIRIHRLKKKWGTKVSGSLFGCIIRTEELLS